MGVRAAQDVGVGLARTVDVVGVLAAAGQKRRSSFRRTEAPMPSKGSETFMLSSPFLFFSLGRRGYSAARASSLRRPCITSAAAAIAFTMLW
jgi:hypothetical protein